MIGRTNIRQRATGVPARPSFLPRASDPEGLINWGRVINAIFASLAVYLDPTQPVFLVSMAYSILGGYVLYSFLPLVIRPPRRLERSFQIATTLIDMAVIAVLIYITGELESPFFVFYTFLLIAAAIRWDWAGTIATAMVLEAILIFVGVPDVSDGDSQLNFLIIRSVFCWVTVVMLGYFGHYRNRSNSRLRELASWPHDIVPEGDRPWLSSSLRHASKVLGAARIIVVWRDHDTPGIRAAACVDEACEFFDRPTLPEHALAAFDSEGAIELVDAAQSERLRRDLAELSAPDWPREPPGSWISVYAATFRSIRFRGTVIVINPDYRDRDVALLTQIIASRIAMELEQFALVRNYAASASLKERVRLGRDLHDSVLQDLTAAVLQLSTAERRAPSGTSEMLRQIRTIFEAHQVRIRHFVGETRVEADRKRSLADQLQIFVEPLGAQWDCRVTIRIDPPALEVSDRVATELCLALSEATANAARHGGADAVAIEIVRRGATLDVVIRDNGTGSDRHGIPRPTSLTSRVADLGGGLAVSRQRPGLRVQMEIPLEAAAP